MTLNPPHLVATPQAPWHMWGNSQRLTAEAPAGTGAGTILFPEPRQLAKVTYRRPETWSFLFFARLLPGLVSDVDIQVIVEFNLILGIGRTMFDTAGLFGTDRAFAQFRWNILAGVTPGVPDPRPKWTSSTQSPTLDEVTGTGTEETIRWFPSEDIQCLGRGAIVLGGVTAVDNRVVVEMGAWFAPRTHVRPDWFVQPVTEEQEINVHAMQYAGNETKGT